MTGTKWIILAGLVWLVFGASCTSNVVPPVQDPVEDIPSIDYQWEHVIADGPYYNSASELVELQEQGQPVAGVLVSGSEKVTVLALVNSQLEWRREMDWHSREGWFGVGELEKSTYVQVDDGLAELDDSGVPRDDPPREVEDSRVVYASFATDSFGYPIAAWEAYPGQLHFARSEGVLDNPIWQRGQPVLRFPPGETQFGRARNIHLMVLRDGTLLITYVGESGLNVVRSLDNFGDSWGPPVLLQPLGTGITLQRGTVEHLMIDGKPALIYYGSGLFYMRALDDQATQWSEPQLLVPGINNTVYARASIIELQGRPVVTYEYQGINIIQASDPLGESWGEPQLIDAEGYGRISTQVIGDKLVVSYMTGDRYASKPTLALAELGGTATTP